MNFRAAKKARTFFTRCATTTFSDRTILHTRSYMVEKVESITRLMKQDSVDTRSNGRETVVGRDWARGWTVRGITPPWGAQLFLFSTPVQTALGSNKPPLQWVQRLFPGSMAAGVWP
jgi:hypothetical protein